jgi:hypothetical protein
MRTDEQDNNININITSNNMIDDFYTLIINKSTSIPDEFYMLLKKIDLGYNPSWFEIMMDSNKKMIKEITYAVYELYNSEFKSLLVKANWDSLTHLYRLCVDQNKKTDIQDFVQYYKRALINKYTNNSI